MIYFSAALVLIFIIISIKPIEIRYTKSLIVKEEGPTIKVIDTQEEQTKPEDPNVDRPPTLDDIVQTLNETLYEFGGDS